ncbi:MAG: cytidylyltransferase domain-containing protein [Planctomycetota bacterium]
MRGVLAIVQARAGSTRLPGKVLADIAGVSMLARVTERARRARLVEAVVVATSTLPGDDLVAAEAARLGLRVCRGSEQDVLARFLQAARECEAAHLVRLTADCPLLDPTLVDDVVRVYQEEHPDYASNGLVPGYPRGLDVEAFSTAALERAGQQAQRPYERSHVTPYFYEHPELFRLRSLTPGEDLSAERWTVDTPEDLAFVRAVYAAFAPRTDFSWQETLAAVQREPRLAELNRHVRQKALREG